MRLKSIKLVGFKSFVEGTTVPFPTNMTCIVGPNGCGKSNIIDAVRWVMGESSAKHLRGESMADVIFNGSTNRQPVGQASIELLFDNSAGALAGEYASFSEISIKRKVTRDGQSQYFLNGSKCRRRDVTDIFLGTGMGPRSYAIIEQGMISRLIESKPEELRVYLEEAAGISKYKERRRETENRMRRTQDNLERLSDIREELGKQLSNLKRQANAAERFGELKKSERELNAQLRAINWKQLEGKRLSLESQVKHSEKLIERLVIEKSTGMSKIEADRALLEERQEAFNELQGRYYQSGAEIAKLEQQLKFERDRAERGAQEFERLKDEIGRSDERSRVLSEELLDKQQELEHIQPELEILEENTLESAEHQEVAQAKFQAWLEANEEFQEKALRARAEAESQQSQVSRSEALIQQLNERLVRLDEEKQRLNSESENSDLESLLEQLASFEEAVARTEAELAQGEQALNEIQAEHEKSREIKREKQEALSETRAVLASLETLQKAALSKQQEPEAFNKYLSSVNAERVLDKITVDEDWSEVLELVLGTQLFAPVQNAAFDERLVPFQGQAWTVFTEAGRTDGKSKPGTLADKVTGLPALYPILNTVRLAVDLGAALTLQEELGDGELIATKDGFVLGRSWCTSCGEEQNSEAGVIARSEQIEELAARKTTLEQALAVLGEEQNQLSSKISEYSKAVADSKARHKQAVGDYSAMNNRLSASKARLEQFKMRLSRNQEDIVEVMESLETERHTLEESRDRWQLSLEALEQLDETKLQHGEERERLQAAIDTARDAYREVQSKQHALNLSRQQIQSRIEILQHSIENTQITLARAQDSLASIENDSLDQALIEDINSKLQNELDLHARDEERLAHARKEQEEIQERVRQSEQGREKIESQLLEGRSDLEKLRLQVQAILMEQKQDLNAIEEDAFVLEEMVKIAEEQALTEEGLQQELERIGNRIQRLGPINLAAIDEYEQQSERKQYLDEQNDELCEALATLEGAIRKIDKETRQRFKETYEQVNAGLQSLFPKIFGGGTATLELTDSDLLETGVAIIARPPGKNNSTIHLLSGGEKALTALALIFSIFKLNPAPFCMLDEVDAPLDDANVGRFARLVKEMSDSVQFIYISHNKVSMEMADQLMGVTMHEPGVSRLVSVDVDQAAQLAEAG